MTTAPAPSAVLEAGAARPVRQRVARRRPVRPGLELPAEVAADLSEARAAVRRCEWERASQLALRSLRARETAEAYALLAMAYCCKPDIGNANSMLRNVRGRARAAAIAFCRKRGQMVQP